VGNDSTCDGHVDRWDRDSQLLAAEEAAADKAAQAAAADAGAAPAPVSSNNVVDAGASQAKGRRTTK
jgi:hypothetical protein